ncbi:MAG: tRNA uridine-5-carboxymethylaminomethyl(34) synthesis GTPase MnmE [Desulfobacterales bacterium]
MLTPETIVAPATPSGEGSVAIVRLSGPRAVACLATAFRGRVDPTAMESHRLYHGRLYDKRQQYVDEVLAVIMRAPHSYTGEDVVEVHGHGGHQVLRNTLDLFLAAGARMAEPGEFTQRAFLNGRLDLAQAEAVIEVIRARSERAGRIALEQLDGRLSREIERFSKPLKEALTLLEAHIDFPEDELGTLDRPALLEPMPSLAAEMQQLSNSFDFGRALREGISILILGRPNVGKSSLMNAMLGETRAIVTDVPGTTRDTLEEQFVLNGIPIRLIDAAGVRDTEDPVEKEGVRRARSKAAAADLVLLLLDGSVPLTNEDLLAIDLCHPDKTLVVINKSDQAQQCDVTGLIEFDHPIEVSAKYGLGLETLSDAIAQHLTRDAALADHEGTVVTERRHRDALEQARLHLDALLQATAAEAPLECLALELRDALAALGQITGETTPDDILNQIFSRFCIGK